MPPRCFRSIITFLVLLFLQALSGCGGGGPEYHYADRRIPVPSGTATQVPAQPDRTTVSHDVRITVLVRHSTTNAPVAGAIVEMECPSSSNCLRIRTTSNAQGEAFGNLVFYANPGTTVGFYTTITATFSGKTVATRAFIEQTRQTVSLFWP